MYVYIVEPSGFRVLGIVVALGVPFNKQRPLSQPVIVAINAAVSQGAATTTTHRDATSTTLDHVEPRGENGMLQEAKAEAANTSSPLMELRGYPKREI